MNPLEFSYDEEYFFLAKKKYFFVQKKVTLFLKKSNFFDLLLTVVFNKNSNAVVDRGCQELEEELRKL